MIPWRGRLRIRTYNQGKLIKYGLLVRMVTESTSGYILNLKTYAGKGKKIQETIFTLLEPYLDQNYHVYQDNYYNHVTIAETLLSRQVCGTGWTGVFLQKWKTSLWNVAKPHPGERVKFFNPGGILVLSTWFPQFMIQQWLMFHGE